MLDLHKNKTGVLHDNKARSMADSPAFAYRVICLKIKKTKKRNYNTFLFVQRNVVALMLLREIGINLKKKEEKNKTQSLTYSYPTNGN